MRIFNYDLHVFVKEEEKKQQNTASDLHNTTAAQDRDRE
jgi:hypothetical protein